MSHIRPAACLLLAALLGGATAIDTTAIEHAERRGLALARYDRAAWVSTDDLMSRLPAERRPEVGGWIVTPAPGGLHVDYVGKGAAAERVVYAADFDGRAIVHAVVHPRSDEPPLSEPAVRMIRALGHARAEIARHADWRPCTPAPFNPVVLPPEADGTVPVYFLTAQTERGAFPFGGHYEVDVAPDGHVAAARSFTKTCLTMSGSAHPPGVTPAGLAVTHLLDPQPTEIHVFEQLQAGLPVYVGTGANSIWKVENGRIEQASP